MIPKLLEDYRKRVVPVLQKRFKYKNNMQAPKLVKIVVNMGIGEATQDVKLLDSAMEDLAVITGQKPIIRRAKKSVANFKVRTGMPVGCMVTLRGYRMYDFLYRFVNAVIPRIRDFRGLSIKSFDGRGNFSMGISEHIIFPEINRDKVNRIWGADITIVTTAKTDEEGRELLREMGMPFVRKE